jgi:hypothetical protein
MKHIGRRKALLASALAATLGLVAYHALDLRYLERDCQSTAMEKARQVAGQLSPKYKPTAGAHVDAWRAIPLFGTPSAKVTVDVRLQLASGSDFVQTYDYFFKRQGSKWVEMEANCAHGPDSGGEHDHHGH